MSEYPLHWCPICEIYTVHCKTCGMNACSTMAPPGPPCSGCVAAEEYNSKRDRSLEPAPRPPLTQDEQHALFNKTPLRTKWEDVERVLYEVWDPLDLNNCAPKDEYSSYVGTIRVLLEMGDGEAAIVRHLNNRVGTCMSGIGTTIRSQVAAKALVGLLSDAR